MNKTRRALLMAMGIATSCASSPMVFAADSGRTSQMQRRSHVRAHVPDAAQIYHSGGFYRPLRGDAYVGFEKAALSNPFSYNFDGNVGDYDDGPRCTLTRQGAMFFFGHRFVRICR